MLTAFASIFFFFFTPKEKSEKTFRTAILLICHQTIECVRSTILETQTLTVMEHPPSLLPCNSYAEWLSNVTVLGGVAFGSWTVSLNEIVRWRPVRGLELIEGQKHHRFFSVSWTITIKKASSKRGIRSLPDIGPAGVLILDLFPRL